MPARPRTLQAWIGWLFYRPVAGIAMGAALALGACGGDGGNGPSQTQPVVSGIRAGGDNTCAVVGDNKAVFCWGANEFGQVGDGTVADQGIPTAVRGAPPFVLPVPGDHVCAADLTLLYCWGRNLSGEVGNGTNSPVPAPSEVQLGLRFLQVAVGDDFTCGVAESGIGYCWGANDVGQLGTGLPQSEVAPRAVRDALSFSSIAAAGRTACGVSGTQLFCWGDGRDGELGNGQFDVNASVPTAVPGTLHFTSVAIGANAAGEATVCAVAQEGPYCWGKNGDGEIGDGTTDLKNTPTPVAGLDANVQLAPGGSHTCARLASAEVVCWGRAGRLGDGTSAVSLTPVAVAGGHLFAAIFAGRDHTCGRTDDDPSRAYCWGENSRGQLGDGTTQPRPAPVLVSFPE